MTAANDPSSAGPPHGASPASPDTSPIEADKADGQTAPTVAGESKIPLPPRSQPPQRQTTPEQLAWELMRLDRGIVVLALVLAFLLASFAVRNPDFWMHLATGRLIAQGEYDFGRDPYSYMPTSYWANHAWLFDLGLYALTSALGGPEAPAAGALVVVKALLVTALAWVMIQTCRRDQSLWAPAACTGLALLVMSPRLSLHPMLVSLLFLALTLYLLQRPRHPATGTQRPKAGSRSPLAIYWLLPPLFVLWVNLDSWFLLGPLTVALYLVGQRLQQWLAPIRSGAESPLPGQHVTLALVLLVGLAACLINPHHYHAFTLPTAFSSASLMQVFEKDRYLRQFFLSPWIEDGVAYNAAALAYYPLFLLGLGSFVLSVFAGWRWWRLVIWFAFALFSGYQLRNIALFAVVAGPITALNLQDFAAARLGKTARLERVWLAWLLGGRIVTILVGVALLLAAWPGWLHGSSTRSRQSHRVAWTIELDPSLRQVTEQLRAWRSEGLLQRNENGFNYSPDFAYYCAWFCPEQKGFFDTRFDLFPNEVAKTYVDLRQTFRQNPAAAGHSSPEHESWQRVFLRNHISHVVLNGLDLGLVLNTAVIAPALLQDWHEWSMLYMDGRTAVFRWNRAADGSDRIKRFDPNPFAFGPHPEVAPAEGPGRPPLAPDVWARFLHVPPPPPPEADKAARYLDYFEIIRSVWPKAALVSAEYAAWSGVIGNAATSPATGTVWAHFTFIQTTLPFRAALHNNPAALQYFLADKDYGPPAAPLLAVRAARQAIAASPDDAAPYFTLAEAYTILARLLEQHWATGSRVVTQGLLPRQTLRNMQITAAREHYLKLRPEDYFSRLKLYETYLETNNFDKAMDHLEAAIHYAPLSLLFRRDEKEFKRTMENLQKELEGLRSQVSQRENEFDLRKADLPLLKKAQMAAALGLGKRALSLLLEADSAQMDREEAGLQLELLLEAGQPEIVLERLPDVKGVLIGMNYQWLRLMTSAVMGDYHQADEYLAEIIRRHEKDKAEGILHRLAHGQAFLGNFNPGAIQSLLYSSQQIAEFYVLRGLLALEEGRPAAAARYFQQALDSGGGGEFDFASRGVAVRYLQLIKQAGGDKEELANGVR